MADHSPARRFSEATSGVWLIFTGAGEVSRPGDGHGLHFGLQFTAVQHRPPKIDQRNRSSLNRFGQPRPELLMRLG